MNQYTINDIWERASKDDLRAELLNTLITLDDFCKEHQLPYVLSGGTLLGAVRHHGFIPWDDDIDVNMPRPVCEKLMELSGGRIGSCILEPPNYSNEYHAYHWKLYNPNILVRKKKGGKVYPIFIDIFPIEGLPDTVEGTEKHYKHIIFWKDIANCLWGKKWFRGATLKTKFGHAALRPFASIWGKEKLFRKVLGVMTKYSYEDSEYVGVMATRVHTTEERVVKKDYMNIIDVTFEGRTFPAPASYDVYLTQLYGSNYMELPPENKRMSNHGLIPYWSKLNNTFKDDIMAAPVQIAMYGLIKSANLGEMFIARSLEFLIRKVAKEHGLDHEIDFVEIDLLGRKEEQFRVKGILRDKLINYSHYSFKGIFTECFYIFLKKAARKLDNKVLKNLIYRIQHMIYSHGRNYKKRLYRYFSRKMRNCDFIVVDGAGLLEYSYNEYQESLYTLSELASDIDLPIVYNAIGRAGEYDEGDFRSTILRKALRSDQVKYVSARDSRETVQRCAGHKHKVKLLADAAFWLKEVYCPQPAKERKKVGIGLVRGNSLQGYGFKFRAMDWVLLFSNIARTLKARGYDFEFFTNGLPGDIVLGQKILQYMDLGPEYLVERPVDEKVLYETINGYQGIITCRMHSAIAAFTLDVPSVILSWNDKVVKLMDHIGYKDRAITPENFNSVYIVDKFEQAMKEGIDSQKLQVMKDKAQESVEAYIDLIIDSVNNRHSIKAMSFEDFE